jgi:hypothetical protein
VQANFDARYDTPPADQGLLKAPTVSDSLGMRQPQVVTPREPARSMPYHRLARADNFRMPQLPPHRMQQTSHAWKASGGTDSGKQTGRPRRGAPGHGERGEAG